MSSTTNRTAVDLFREYRLDYEAALEPCLTCLLERCPESELEALRALLEDYMDRLPMPPHSPVQQRRLRQRIEPLMDRVFNDPGVMAQQDQRDAAWRDKPWWTKAWSRVRLKVMWAWITRPRPFAKKPWE